MRIGCLRMKTEASDEKNGKFKKIKKTNRGLEMSRKQKDAAVAQSVVRRIGSAEVTGPIPVSSSARKERKPLIYKGFRFFILYLQFIPVVL